MTPATVGVLQRNNTVRSIYVNGDGYPSNMLPVLKSLVEEGSMSKVIAEGDASFLTETFVDSCFYCRDRHEDFEDVEPQVWDSIEDFTQSSSDQSISHIYLIELDGSIVLLGDRGSDD